MKKYIAAIIVLAVGLLVALRVTKYKKQDQIMRGSQTFSGVKKVRDDLYIGKVAPRFYLAMERVGPDALERWIEYAKKQKMRILQKKLKYLPSADGVDHFLQALDVYKKMQNNTNNELWIVYASDDNPVKNKAFLGLDSSIEMYMSVVTSTKALVSSHFGISRTWEAASDLEQKPSKRKRHPGQSLYLHSFAAKVIKLRDPKKVYMLTVPNAAMRNILLKKMPAGSIFIGDNLYQEKLKEAEKNPNLALLGANPPRICRAYDMSAFTIQNPNGTTLITLDKNAVPYYQWLFTKAYRSQGILLPYVLIRLDALARLRGLVK